MLSVSEVVTSSPCPVRSRRSKAAIIPIAAYIPDNRSEIGGAARIGGSPSSPFTLIKPLMACAIKSKDGRSAYGPSKPKPVRLQLTKSGLIWRNASRPKPIVSITPGLKLFTTTSAVANNLRKMSLPSSLRRSMASERLLRLNVAK